jgi:hypothetical protein
MKKSDNIIPNNSEYVPPNIFRDLPIYKDEKKKILELENIPNPIDLNFRKETSLENLIDYSNNLPTENKTDINLNVAIDADLNFDEDEDEKKQNFFINIFKKINFLRNFKNNREIKQPLLTDEEKYESQLYELSELDPSKIEIKDLSVEKILKQAEIRMKRPKKIVKKIDRFTFSEYLMISALYLTYIGYVFQKNIDIGNIYFNFFFIFFNFF